MADVNDLFQSSNSNPADAPRTSAQSAFEDHDPGDPRLRRRALIAATSGTIIEFYDYQLFAVMTVVIAPLFFATQSSTAAILSTLALFAVPFLARPFGGIVFGTIGDRYGRRKSLVLTIGLMGLGSGLIGALPTYATIGNWAPALLFLLRLVQSASAGGEVSGATSYVVESAPAHRRGFYGGILGIGGIAGLGLASATVLLLNTVLTSEQISSWAWRLPFLLTLGLTVVSLYIRLALEDTPAFVRAQARKSVSSSPVKLALTRDRANVLRVFGAAAVQSVGGYLTTVFAITYLIANLGYSTRFAATLSTVALLFGIAVSPLAGALSDRIGRKPVVAAAQISFVTLTWPLLWVLSVASEHPPVALIAFVLLTLPAYVLSGVAWTLYAEVFPTNVRNSGMAIGFNAAVMLGGASPFLASLLIDVTGYPLAPAFMVSLIGVVSLLVLRTMRETGKSALLD
ncbi:MAG: MFS transporter [Hyphomicrobiales bacterium]|nr:MAG: MFS transporter [Hyphomicrobiales bacterium]